MNEVKNVFFFLFNLISLEYFLSAHTLGMSFLFCSSNPTFYFPGHSQVQVILPCLENELHLLPKNFFCFSHIWAGQKRKEGKSSWEATNASLSSSFIFLFCFEGDTSSPSFSCVLSKCYWFCSLVNLSVFTGESGRSQNCCHHLHYLSKIHT